MSPGTRVSDGILTGTVLDFHLAGQVLVQSDSGGLFWQTVANLRRLPDAPKPRTFLEAVEAVQISCGGPKAADTCKEIGCDDIATCKGLCNKHYKQMSYRRRKGQEDDGWN